MFDVLQLCGYRTNYRGNLQKHIRVHTGERPYRCNVCNKGFTTSSNLKMHMLRHHGEGPKPPASTARLPQWTGPFPQVSAPPQQIPSQFSSQLVSSNPELMRQYYATLVGQAFAQQGALIPMMQQAAMMHHSMAQTDKKPVVGVDVPSASSFNQTPEREPDSCVVDEEMEASEAEQKLDKSKFPAKGNSFSDPFPELPDPSQGSVASSSQINTKTEDDIKPLTLPSSDTNDKLPKSPKAQDTERRTSLSSGVTAASPRSLDGATGDLDLSRSSERSTDKRSSDEMATSMLDDLVQKGRLYSCQYCNIYFPELSMYVFHKGCHGPDAPFQCNFCYETFNKFDFMAHFLFCVHSNRK